MKKYFYVLLSLLALVTVLFFGCSARQASSPSGTAPATEQKAVIKVGVSPVPAGEILEFVKKNLAPQAGLDIQMVMFNDGVQNNFALRDGQIDANYFQHTGFMEDFGQRHNIKMVGLQPPVHLNPVAAFSKRHKSLSELPQNGLVAIPDDITNAHRSLKLLEASGLLKLKNNAGILASVKDIVENPKNLRIKEIPSTQMIPSLPDLDLGVMTGNLAVQAGMLTNKDSLAIESGENPRYAVLLTTLQGKENDPRIQKLNQLFHDPKVRDFIKEKYQGAVIPMF